MLYLCSHSGRGEEGKRTFTIRGLDPELYERFVRVAKDLGMSVGALMNEAMRAILALTIIGKEASERIGREVGKASALILSKPIEIVKSIVEGIKDFEVITSIGELTVSKVDLEKIDKAILFVNIRKLTFDNDVDWELLNTKVKGVKLVDEVVIPKHIPKLLFAKKCTFVKKITVR